MNHTLSGKLIWQIGEDYGNILLANYGMLRNGWDTQAPSSHQSGLWRNIKSIRKGVFFFITKLYSISESGFFFYYDTWIKDKSSALQYLDLFQVCTVVHLLKVAARLGLVTRCFRSLFLEGTTWR